MCQNCLSDTIPFQTLDDLEYEFTVLNGKNISENDMDRLRHLKFNPFDSRFNNIALSENNVNMEKTIINNCEYYLPNDFNKFPNKANLNESFSMLHLNTRSIVNKFDSFKELTKSLNIPIEY